jgi:uncharacterized protein YdbL (DUF1318 family)
MDFIKSLLANKKTTLGGLAAFLTVAAAIAHQMSMGVPLEQAITAPDVLGLILGYLGLVGKDATTHSTLTQVEDASVDATAKAVKVAPY